MKNIKKYHNSNRKITDYDALLVFQQMFKPPNDIEYFESSMDNQFIMPSCSNQEKEYLKKESWEMLSDEAKEVILTVLDTPKEILASFITEKVKKYSKNLIRQYYLDQKRWNKFQVNKIFNELNNFVTQFD